MMETIPGRKKEQGFSLTEMMVVLAILGVVMAAMYSMFNHQQKSYAVQDDVAVMQQNVRVGLDYLVKNIRMAGYIPEDIPYDPLDPPLPTPHTDEPSSDVPGQPFSDGDAEPVEHATATAITFQADIDDDAITETVRYALSGTDLTMEVWKWSAATLSWGPGSGAQIIAQDIENLVFTYVLLADDYGLDNGVDDDGDGSVDEQGELKIWNFGADGPLTNAERRHIRQVSILINSRSAAKDPAYTHPTEGDHYRRRTLSSNIALRNL